MEYFNNRHKYIAFKLNIPAEYYCKVNDILNEFMDKYNMSEGDIMQLAPLIQRKHDEYVEQFPESMNNNFFDELILKRNNGVRAAKDFIDSELAKV